VNTAIERLRASKQKWHQEERTQGHLDGRGWAENEAEYGWLRRLADNIVRDRVSRGALFRAIDPNDEDEKGNSELSETFFGGEKPSDAYIEGFVEAAVEFFAEVRDQI